MPTYITGRGRIVGDIHEDIFRLENLLADLKHLATGQMPLQHNLDLAPIIDNWAYGVRSTKCLVGRMHNHPTCDGPLSVTSALWCISPEMGWARTESRFFLLGKPAFLGELQ